MDSPGNEEKWFITSSHDSEDALDKTLVYPHTNNLQSNGGLICTYGNHVQQLIDGKEIMGCVNTYVQEMIAEKHNNPGTVCQLWIANFVINNVSALGENGDAPPLLDLLDKAAEAGVEICLLISAQGGSLMNGSLPLLRAVRKMPYPNIRFIWDQRYVFWG